MRTEPLNIDGLAGPVEVHVNALFGSPTVTVGGHEASRVGRATYALPVAGGGTTDAMLRGGFIDTYPSLEINGVKHRTGPQAPVPVRILILLPLLLVFV